MSRPSPEQLGPPHVRLGAFQLWVHGWEFPNALNKDDGNWLNVVAHCGGDGASVWASGPIMDTVGLRRFRDQLKTLRQTLVGKAALFSQELDIDVRVAAHHSALPSACLRVEVDITPNPSVQSHRFEFEIDPGELEATVAQLESVLKAYPVID
jgi:hypothetical protein